MAAVAVSGVDVRRPSRGVVVALILVLWLALWAVLRGLHTLALGPAQLTPLHQSLNDLNDAIGASRNTNPLFLYFFNEIRLVIDEFVIFLQSLIAQPAFDRPYPLIGWLGVVALAAFVSYAAGGVRVALLAAAGFTFLGLQGLWEESMDTLALTLAAVIIALLFGIPLGIWAGLSDRFNKV
ncbi:MAG: hypothetical protein ABIQ18_47985, partial [Umezawaea sp.]